MTYLLNSSRYDVEMFRLQKNSSEIEQNSCVLLHPRLFLGADSSGKLEREMNANSQLLEGGQTEGPSTRETGPESKKIGEFLLRGPVSHSVTFTPNKIPNENVLVRSIGVAASKRICAPSTFVKARRRAHRTISNLKEAIRGDNGI